MRKCLNQKQIPMKYIH